MANVGKLRKSSKRKQRSFIAQMIGFNPLVAVIAFLIFIIAGSIYYVVNTKAATAWPLKISPNGRYFVDQNNKPFLYTADTAWASLKYLSVADVKRLIDLRKAQGFNTIQANIVGWERSVSGPHGAPFQGDDLTKPNEAYFADIDAILRYAESQDMLVLVGALWTADNGGRAGGRLPSTAELQSYGSYLGNRYKNFGNIMWFVGGDDEQSTNLDSVKTLGNALRTADPTHLITYHTWGKGYNVKNEPWLGFYSFQWNSNSSPYSYNDVAEGLAQIPIKPVLDIEPAYEPEACCGSDMLTSLQENRRNGWWAILSGAMGVVYGGPKEAWNIGQATNGTVNVTAINRPAATHTANIRKILEPYPWEKLVPDTNNSVVTGGRGTRGNTDYVTAARANDGSFIAAYTPSSRTVTVNMAHLVGPAQGYWVDPTTGNKTDLGANLTNSGSKTFSTPGTNAGGDTDFVLLLIANQPPTQTPTPTPVLTATPTPGGDPLATPTPIPTSTPIPTPTVTPIPTVTPLPTATRTPTPTLLPSLNLIRNPSFESGLTSWQLQVGSPATANATTTTSTKADGAYSAQIAITKSSSSSWSVQFKQNNVPLLLNRSYTLSFWARASSTRRPQVVVQQVASPYKVYFTQSPNLTTNWQRFTYTFTSSAAVANTFVGFNLAQNTGTVNIDGVSLTLN